MRRLPFITALALCALVTQALAEPDLSTPKQAVISFGEALSSGNAEDAKAAVVPDQLALDLVTAMADIAKGTEKLRVSAVKKFGEEGNQLAGEQMDMKADMEKLKEAEEKIDGDTATVTMKDQPESAITLKKIEGKWKLDAGAMLGDDARQMLPVFKAMGRVFPDVATEIDDGKHETIASARQALQAKMMQAMMGAAGAAPQAQPEE